MDRKTFFAKTAQTHNHKESEPSKASILFYLFMVCAVFSQQFLSAWPTHGTHLFRWSTHPLSKPSVFLPDSMTLLIHSHPINLEYQAHVYNPSSCPTIFQSLFPVIARFFAVLVVIKADVFMLEHTVRFIEVFHPNQSSFHLPDQIHKLPDDPLIQPPSKNVHLFLTVPPFFTYPRSPKTP